MHRRSQVAAILALIAVTALTSGCGPAGNSDSAKKDAPGGSSAKKAPGGNSDDFCKELKDELNGLNAVFPKDFGNADELKTYGEFVKKSNAALVKSAPSQIAADVRLQAGISDKAADAYLKGAPPSADVRAQLTSAEYIAASKRVSEYAKTKCGISASTSP